MKLDSEQTADIVSHVIAHRRTLPWTRMKPDPIRPDHLAKLLEAANWAPSHRHTEPWRFVVFRGEGRQKLADLLATTYREFSGDAFNEKKFIKAQTRPLAVPLTLAIIMRPCEQPQMPEFEEMLAMGCAMQNMHLMAQSLGIGCSWSTPAYLDHKLIRTFFQLGARDRCLGFYYVGYADGPFPHSKRGPIDQKTTFIES